MRVRPAWLLLPGLLALLLGFAALFVLPRRAALETLLAIGGGAHGRDGALRPGMVLLRDSARLGFPRVLVARPQGPGPHPVLVLVHGVALRGLDDARVIAAAGAFRDAGFLVVAPQVPVLVSPPEQDHDLSRMTHLLAAVAEGRVAAADPARFGVVGVSVGGGFALRAVARFQAAGGRGPRAVLAIGAPDDLKRIMPAWFSLPRPGPDTPPGFARTRCEEARFARNVVFRAALRARVPDPHDRTLLRQWLEANLDPWFCPRGLRSPEGFAFQDLVAHGPATWAHARAALVDEAWPLLRVFSPAASGDELRGLAGVVCFLLHGTRDPLVPVSELQALAARLRPITPTVAFASRMIGHVDVEEVGWPEQAAHVVFLDDFFDLVGS